MKEMRSATLLLPTGKISLRVDELTGRGLQIALRARDAVLIELKGGN
jgi:hypothetical protein